MGGTGMEEATLGAIGVVDAVSLKQNGDMGMDKPQEYRLGFWHEHKQLHAYGYASREDLHLLSYQTLEDGRRIPMTDRLEERFSRRNFDWMALARKVIRYAHQVESKLFAAMRKKAGAGG